MADHLVTGEGVAVSRAPTSTPSTPSPRLRQGETNVMIGTLATAASDSQRLLDDAISVEGHEFRPKIGIRPWLVATFFRPRGPRPIGVLSHHSKVIAEDGSFLQEPAYRRRGLCNVIKHRLARLRDGESSLLGKPTPPD